MNNNNLKIKIFSPWTWTPLFIFALLFLLLYFTKSNVELFLGINKVSEYTSQWLWANVTLFGDGLVAAVLLSLWMKRRPDIVWALIIAMLISGIGSQILKQLVEVARPAGVLSPSEFILIGPKFQHHSFPSGHSATIFSLCGVWIMMISKNYIRMLLLIFASLVAISRIAVGIHWPMDILAGSFLGWLTAWAGIILAHRSEWGYSRLAQFIIGGLLIIASLILLLKYDTRYEVAFCLQRGIAFLTLIFGIEAFVSLFKIKNIN